jgi:hypothetical protein
MAPDVLRVALASTPEDMLQSETLHTALFTLAAINTALADVLQNVL